MEVLAKRDKPLTEHLLEVYNLGKLVSSRLNLNDNITKRALLACLLHDIGKATKSFQKHIRNNKHRAYPHALASLPFILIAEQVLFGKPFYASAAVLSHHSPLSPWLYEGWNPPKMLPQTADILKEIFSRADEFNIDIDILYSKALSITNPSQIIHKFNKRLLIELKNLNRKEFATVKSVLHLADWLSSSGKSDISSIFLNNGKEALTNFINSRNYKLRGFQRAALEHESTNKLYLRAPTGSGKTEALLLWAGNSERIIYLLPTQATANAMWNRLQNIYGKDNVGISHGRSKYIIFKRWNKENCSEEEPPLEYKLFASVFAKPVVVATLDQFLMGYMNGKHWEERQTLSRHSAILIDEIHSYEPFTLGILKYVLENENLKKVAMASATLPDALLNLFDAENVLEADENFWHRRRYKIIYVQDVIESYISKAVQLAQKGLKILIIVNTVGKSQQLYEELHRLHPDTILLHSRFTYKDRIEKENQIMQAEPGTILISTQIVEVSLDISYDILLTELAPIDALIQRMGRVNRKGDKPPANIIIFEELDEYSRKVYGEEILDISANIIQELPPAPTDRDLVQATNKLYNLISTTDHFHKEIMEGQNNISELQKYLGNYTIDLGDEEFCKRFITRKGIFSIDVIPETLLNDAYNLLESGKRWQLVELTIPVHAYWTHIWKEQFYPSEDLGYFIVRFEYDKEKGLIKPDSASIEPKSQIW